jgi:V/A-type H+-transporting ATPase subunit I
MAIVKMNKFTLLAFESQRADLLKNLQGFAEVEFLNLQDEEFLDNNELLSGLVKEDSGLDYAGCEDNLSMASLTLLFLKKYVHQKSTFKRMKEGKRELTFNELEETVINSNWKEICEKIKEKEREIVALVNEKTKLQNEIDLFKPWETLDVAFGELKSIKIPIFLGSLPKQYEETIISDFKEDYLEIVSKDNQDLYILLICDKDKKEEINEKLKGFGFSQFKTEVSETAIEIIHNNIDNIEKIRTKIFFLEEALAGFEKEEKVLENVCDYYENIIIRKNATNNFLNTENIMVIQGWVPEKENEGLTKIIRDTLGDTYNLTFEEVKDEEISNVPVKLENNELNSAFESVTKMYSTPKYDEIDPTPLLAPFYLLFFGMMVADIGYGLILLTGTILALKLLKLEEDTRKFIKFFFYLSFSTIGFGVLYGSFFGNIKVPGLEPFIDPINNITTLLVVSVIFGVLQIFMGLGIKAYMLIRIGKYLDAFYDVGSWVITLISIGLVLGSSTIGLPEIGKKIAIVTMIFGMAVIVLKSGRAEKSKGAQLGQGLYALYGISGYIGDLVSYTRLMALGLAGGSLAGAFNLLAGMIPGAAFFLFGPLIFIFGHMLNIGLSFLGAYVHTCRLQYVEYFGKFYEGGGKAFTPFKLQNKFINIKKN